MINKVAVITILVRDQEEALTFYTEKLGFEKRSDQMFGPGARWLTVAPKGQKEIEITLLQPNEAMHSKRGKKRLEKLIGTQPTWSYRTDDCRGTVAELESRGVIIVSQPQEQPYGVEAIFQDLYGNTFSLLQARAMPADAAPAHRADSFAPEI